MEKNALLERAGVTGEDVYPLAKVLDRGERAGTRDIPAATDFLSPRQQVLALELLRLAEFPPEAYLLTGGFPGAERKVVLFLPSWLDREALETVLGQSTGPLAPLSEGDRPPDFLDAFPDIVPIRFLRASFRKEDGITHRDLLGSLMGMGVAREAVGDILPGEDSADLAVLEGVEPFLLQSWESAGRAKLRVSSVSPSRLHIPAVNCQEIRDTVSSLRLDAVVSAGFRMGRGKAAELIEAGRVQVDWKECGKPDRILAQGCTVTARGFGKMELLEAGRLTKKGRIAIVIRRYL